MDIAITEKAIGELKRLGAGGNRFLRVKVAPGGCSGMTYTASVESTLNAGDRTLIEKDGLRLVADEGSLIFLDGLNIDFSDDLVQAGFRFTNPRAAKSCGCGASFALQP